MRAIRITSVRSSSAIFPIATSGRMPRSSCFAGCDSFAIAHAYERSVTVAVHAPGVFVATTVTDSHLSSPGFHCTELRRANSSLGRSPNTAFAGAVRCPATKFPDSDIRCERQRTASASGSGSACSPATIPSSNFFSVPGKLALPVNPTSTCNENRPVIAAYVIGGELVTAHHTLSTLQMDGKSKVIVVPSIGRGGAGISL